MKDIAGKTAFVTGAASGIGLGIATALAQAGAKVMLCDIEADALARAVEGLKPTNADIGSVRADVSLKSDLRAAAEATLARFGKVHILVNNAGVGGGGPFGAWSDAAWSWTLDVNLMAVVWGVEIFGPLIVGHGEGGHIVNTASIAGHLPLGSTAYTATKFGVVGLSEALRAELAPRGVGVSALCPGFIKTRIADSARNVPDRFEKGFVDLLAARAESEMVKAVRARIEGGIDPLYVGELVVEGIEKNWGYIFTDTEFEPVIEARYAAIKQGFDQVRGRVPRK